MDKLLLKNLSAAAPRDGSASSNQPLKVSTGFLPKGHKLKTFRAQAKDMGTAMRLAVQSK